MALIAGLRELDAFGAFQKRRREWRVFGDVPQEQLPTGAIAVAHRLDIRHFLPLLVEDHWLGALRIKERFRRRDQRLHEAAVQPAYRRPTGPVDLYLQEIVALNPARPRRADLRRHAARQLEYREGRILDIDRVRIAGLVAALGQRRDVATRHAP